MASSGPRFLADESFNNDLVRALVRHLPDLDVVRAQDTIAGGADDPTLPAWAAREGPSQLAHDATTIPRFCAG